MTGLLECIFLGSADLSQERGSSGDVEFAFLMKHLGGTSSVWKLARCYMISKSSFISVSPFAYALFISSCSQKGFEASLLSALA